MPPLYPQDGSTEEAPVMVHAREVLALKFRSGIIGRQLLDVIKRRPGFGDGAVKDANDKAILHSDDVLPDGHYFFTPWPKERIGKVNTISVLLRGGGAAPAKFPEGTTGSQLIDVLREMPYFGDGTVDDVRGYTVIPSSEALTPGSYFFMPRPGSSGSRVLSSASLSSIL